MRHPELGRVGTLFQKRCRGQMDNYCNYVYHLRNIDTVLFCNCKATRERNTIFMGACFHFISFRLASPVPVPVSIKMEMQVGVTSLTFDSTHVHMME